MGAEGATQFKTASISLDLLSVFSISPGNGDQKQLYVSPVFSTKLFHIVASPKITNVPPLCHTNHPPYTYLRLKKRRSA